MKMRTIREIRRREGEKMHEAYDGGRSTKINKE